MAASKKLAFGQLDDETFIKHVLIGSIVGSGCGGVAAVAGGLLGALGTVIGAPAGEIGKSLAGSIGAAVAGVLIPRGLAQCIKPVGKTINWLFAALFLALAVNTFIGARFDWPFYRWIIPSAITGMVLGAISLPSSSSLLDITSDEHFGLELLGPAIFLNLIPYKSFAAILAGAIGGSLGAGIPAALIGWRAGEEGKEVFGGVIVATMFGVILGFVCGAIGGWRAWKKMVKVGEKTSEI